MKTITPESAKELIDSLADKELSFGCEIIHLHNRKSDVVVYVIDDDNIGTKNEDLHCTKEEIEILGHPILIGNILEKIRPKTNGRAMARELVELWGWCGFNCSLEKIVAGGMIESCVRCGLHKGEEGGCFQSESGTHYKWVKVLKPEVEALFLLLRDLKL